MAESGRGQPEFGRRTGEAARARDRSKSRQVVKFATLHCCIFLTGPCRPALLIAPAKKRYLVFDYFRGRSNEPD
ncbi:hypothetical protein SPHINGOT1_80084 [Sphingomonas sp. T1]|nr:hypothetical protein SPHINGOT1_80084 [Sphingomonas sp. T1]